MPDGTSGQVLTAQGAGADPVYAAVSIPTVGRARAYPSAAQTISHATWTKVTLDTENYDVLGEFASSRYTATVAGYYLCIGSVGYTAVADKLYEVSIYKNGAGACRDFRHSSHVEDVSPKAVDIIYLAVNDYVELYTRQWSGGNLNTRAISDATYLAVTRLLG